MLRRKPCADRPRPPVQPSLVAAVQRAATRSSAEPGRLRSPSSTIASTSAACSAGAPELQRPRGGDWRRSQAARRGGGRIGEAIVDRPRYPGSGPDCFDESRARTDRDRPFNPSLVAAVQRAATRSSAEPGRLRSPSPAPPPCAAPGAGTAATKGWRNWRRRRSQGRAAAESGKQSWMDPRIGGQDRIASRKRRADGARPRVQPPPRSGLSNVRADPPQSPCRRESALGDPHRQSSSVR